ncbi:expressed protein [Echinococcus multilocularis]|uniref:Expressed protein n=1 Tax=Echinococcus multilocularis TaxID=6211 RepID=A0A087VZ76_ECHMU|nr:expressed protein [Echinococcus multilocularis]
MEDKPIGLDTMVELFLTWLLDYKPYVLNICSLNDIAFMFCEERGLKLTKGLMTQFYISTFRFIDKIDRVKGVSQAGALSTAKHETPTHNGVHIRQSCHSGEPLTPTGDTEWNPSLSPPLITTPISNSRRKIAEIQDPLFNDLFPTRSDALN